jgi:uncharacterized protein (DUF58 family)
MEPIDFRQPAEGAYVTLDQLLELRFAARELSITPQKLSRAHMSGGVRTRFRGRGMEFEEVRHYQPGDDIRSIDWRVTARTQVPHTKLFREERERPVIIMLDQRASMFFGSQHCFKSVIAAHAAALIGWAALNNNDRIGALVFGDSEESDIRPKRSRHTLLSVLRATQTLNQQLTSPFAAPSSISLAQRLSDLRRIAKPGSAIMIISDFHDLDSHCDEQLYQLARHGDLTLMNVSDPLEMHLPDNMRLTVSNGRQRRTVDTRNRQFNQTFEQEFNHRLQHLQRLSNQLALPLLQLSTNQAPLTQLQTLFGKQSCRR